MSGFQSPNYTQTPNDFFVMVPDMSDAELRVTLVMIRETFGFHRDGFKMGINKLADAAGLSRNGAKDGAEAAEKRGTFKRTNPDAQTEAEWELVVGQSVTPPPSDHPPGHPVTTPPSPSDQQVGVKERIKKAKKGDLVDAMLHFGKQARDKGLDEIEDTLNRLDRDLKLNISRSTSNQQVARKIIKAEKDGQSLDTFITWLKSDEWRASHLYIYADLAKLWQLFPQAFAVETYTRPEYKPFRTDDNKEQYVANPRRRTV